MNNIMIVVQKPSLDIKNKAILAIIFDNMRIIHQLYHFRHTEIKLG